MSEENDLRSAEEPSTPLSLPSSEVGVFGSVGYEVSIFGTDTCVAAGAGYVEVSDDRIQTA